MAGTFSSTCPEYSGKLPAWIPPVTGTDYYPGTSPHNFSGVAVINAHEQYGTDSRDRAIELKSKLVIRKPTIKNTPYD
jgi:hypothetical protein